MKNENVNLGKLRLSLLVMVLLFGTMSLFSQTLGDVTGDGVVNIVDGLQIARYYVGLNPSPFNLDASDVNCNGSTDIVDALQVARLYVGLIGPFTPCSGGPIVTDPPIITDPPVNTPKPVVGPRVNNPYAGAKKYVDPVWSAKAKKSGSGAAIANESTAVWMDRIGAITDGIGLRGHLDAAIQQGADLIEVVIYDLPNRDCAAAASNGELRIANGGMQRYKSEYIDPIVAIMGDANYAGLRIVCIIEPDSLPNLVTNLNIRDCSEANGKDGYRDGVVYAIDQINTLGNTYCYVDMGHSGWLGWDSNFGPAVRLIGDTIKRTKKGVNSIAGFITCTANYTPLEEPYLPDPNKQVGGKQIKTSSFYEWNPYFGELKFAQDLRSRFISNGFPGSLGMLIDTSRNGWGGPDRPTGPSSSNNTDQYVKESKIDRRNHRGCWCNQPGGIGVRPTAAPASGIDAYVWVKPPGESDGVSTPNFEQDPNDKAKRFDKNCDPNGQSTYGPVKTGAIEAPHAGRWNDLHMDILVKNAYPPL